MSRVNMVGWGLMAIGFAVWVYGYFVVGHAALINWPDLLPAWLAEYLPNLEAEIGLATMIVAMIPTYWPSR